MQEMNKIITDEIESKIGDAIGLKCVLTDFSVEMEGYQTRRNTLKFQVQLSQEAQEKITKFLGVETSIRPIQVEMELTVEGIVVRSAAK